VSFETARLLRIAVVTMLVPAAMVIASCRRSHPPIVFDAGPGADVPLLDRLDSDADGLCDVQEVSRGLMADDPDTDGDGFSDLAEVSLGFDALMPTSPDRARIVMLEERPTARARIAVTVIVSGMGETFSGTFQTVPRVFSDGIDASLYFERASAVGAAPMANIVSVDPEGQQFVGVMGRTALTFDVSFGFDDDAQLGCRRAYPFQYTVKREDGRVVATERLTLVLWPEGATPDEGEWCGARPCW
jgi:hypothetical protein